MTTMNGTRAFLQVLLSATLLVVIVACTCTRPASTVDGGGSRGGNPVVTGMIVGTDGAAAFNVRVSLLTEDYDPGRDIPPDGRSVDFTDTQGIFTLTAPDSGWYNVEAVDDSGALRLLRFHIGAVFDSTTELPDDTLRKPGALVVSFPEGCLAADGYLYVPGTSIVAACAEASGSITFEAVPAETLPYLYYATKSGTARAVRYDIVVQSGETTVISNTPWAYSSRIVLNTSANGAGIGGDVYHFPVLIRLASNNFNFGQALAGGADLMFTGSNGAMLAAEIERWDAAGGHAEIWVRTDTIFGNDSVQFISMYWGNPDAVPQSANGEVFDTADGYQGVWHLNDAPDTSVARDATVNRYHGISPDGARPVPAEGAIGGCRKFDGIDDYITMPNTAGGRLNFPQDGSYSVSAWVRIDTFTDGAPQLIVSKGYEQYYLRSTFFPSTTPSWEIAEFSEDNGWHSSRSPATGGAWVFLTGVRKGKEQRLYCDGVLTDSVKDVWTRSVSRDATNDLSVGAFMKEVTIPDDDGYCFLKGSIDEIRIIGSAKSNDWVRLCYMNQRSDDRLTVFK